MCRNRIFTGRNFLKTENCNKSAWKNSKFRFTRWLSEVRSTESSCEKNTYIVKYIRNAQETYSNFLYEGKAEEGYRMNKKLYKSEDNKVLCGVCGGLGEFLGIDPTIIRLIWVVLAFAGGSGLLIYLLATVIIPRRPLD